MATKQKKFKLREDLSLSFIIDDKHITLYRIQALKDFSTNTINETIVVRKGDIGGYVE